MGAMGSDAPRLSFSEEFKRDAVALVRQPIAQIASAGPARPCLAIS